MHYLYPKGIYCLTLNDSIFSIKDKPNGAPHSFYLTVYNIIEFSSSNDARETIKVFAIENNSLNDTLKLFKTETGLLNEINVDFGFLYTVETRRIDKGKTFPKIKYNTDKKMIYIPTVSKNGKLTKKYIRYKFNGQFFE
jgi:hypothetical protein